MCSNILKSCLKCITRWYRFPDKIIKLLKVCFNFCSTVQTVFLYGHYVFLNLSYTFWTFKG